MPKVFDVFPFFNELDVLELRLNELDPVVDMFVIAESEETYGGAKKPLYLHKAFGEGRFDEFRHKIMHVILPKLLPPLTHTLNENVPGVNANDIRTAGREREAYMRNAIFSAFNAQPNDIISFGDCDEIPRAKCVAQYRSTQGIQRFKQKSFYYNVNTLVDYGRDVCSRARIGTIDDVTRAGGLMNFRKATAGAIENGGWHLSYFGGDVAKIREKVNALSPFLKEYKLFDTVKDIATRKDLHRRPLGFSELPETYQFVDDDDLPSYYVANKDKFKHFTLAAFKEKYKC